MVIPEAIQPVTVFDLILNHTSRACKKKPVFVNKAAVFLVDTTHIGCSDDLGVWKHKGKPVRKYKITHALQSGIIYGADHTQDNGSDVYTLTRIYYHHKNTPEFRRTIFYIHGKHLK